LRGEGRWINRVEEEEGAEKEEEGGVGGNGRRGCVSSK